MRVVVLDERDEYGEWESLEITINDTTKFSVSNAYDSPEDSTLSRNFSDCYDIPRLLRMAYEAGLKGEEFVVEYEENEEDDE